MYIWSVANKSHRVAQHSICSLCHLCPTGSELFPSNFSLDTLIKLMFSFLLNYIFYFMVPTFLNHSLSWAEIEGICFGCIFLKVLHFVELHKACVLMEYQCAVKLARTGVS